MYRQRRLGTWTTCALVERSLPPVDAPTRRATAASLPHRVQPTCGRFCRGHRFLRIRYCPRHYRHARVGRIRTRSHSYTFAPPSVYLPTGAALSSKASGALTGPTTSTRCLRLYPPDAPRLPPLASYREPLPALLSHLLRAAGRRCASPLRKDGCFHYARLPRCVPHFLWPRRIAVTPCSGHICASYSGLCKRHRCSPIAPPHALSSVHRCALWPRRDARCLRLFLTPRHYGTHRRLRTVCAVALVRRACA